jgi:hypothetical protein
MSYPWTGACGKMCNFGTLALNRKASQKVTKYWFQELVAYWNATMTRYMLVAYSSQIKLLKGI